MTLRIDARGLRCPWPAIRLARALREHDGPIEILADDPAASDELLAVASASNCSILAEITGSAPFFRVVRR